MTSLIRGPKLVRVMQLLDDAPPGIVVECGVYQGGTIKAMAEEHPERTFYGFDTFTGLPPEMWHSGEVHKAGEFDGVNLAELMMSMPANVTLIPGLFPESANGMDQAHRPIAFAHVDFDFEESTVAALSWLLPRMAPGGIIVFDDYHWPNCPGVAKAIFRHGLQVQDVGNYQAVWRDARNA